MQNEEPDLFSPESIFNAMKVHNQEKDAVTTIIAEALAASSGNEGSDWLAASLYYTDLVANGHQSAFRAVLARAYGLPVGEHEGPLMDWPDEYNAVIEALLPKLAQSHGFEGNVPPEPAASTTWDVESWLAAFIDSTPIAAVRNAMDIGVPEEDL